jgi:queuine tRNA-ribosyltransferase
VILSIPKFVPILNSEAGLCLSKKNWQEVKINSVAYILEYLLYKPGKDALKKIDDLAHYLAAPGKIILNASSLIANKEGICTLKSPYDGSRISLSRHELIEIIQHLKPNSVILPKNIIHEEPQIWEEWNETIFPFLHNDDLEGQAIEKTHGVYFQEVQNLKEELLAQWSHLPRYIIGSFGLVSIQHLEKNVEFIETDEPARAALQGKIYSQAGEEDLTDAKMEFQFEPLDKHCVCPTCGEGFTRAYLHHLYKHTPLLCYRMLIQHNIMIFSKMVHN